MQDLQDTYDNFILLYTYSGPCNIYETNTTNVTAQRDMGEYQHTVTDLKKYSNYTLIVYATNSAGRSLQTSSSTVNFRTKPEGMSSNLHHTYIYNTIIVHIMKLLVCYNYSTIWEATVTSHRILQFDKYSHPLEPYNLY